MSALNRPYTTFVAIAVYDTKGGKQPFATPADAAIVCMQEADVRESKFTATAAIRNLAVLANTLITQGQKTTANWP